MADLAGQGDSPPTVDEVCATAEANPNPKPNPNPNPKPNPNQVWATAEAEGLDLNAYRSERNQYGFLGVHHPNTN